MKGCRFISFGDSYQYKFCSEAIEASGISEASEARGQNPQPLIPEESETFIFFVKCSVLTGDSNPEPFIQEETVLTIRLLELVTMHVQNLHLLEN